MFKPPKPSGPAQPSRHKLPLVERPPKQDDISTLFTGALRIRGTIFEMPIRPGPLSPVYIVTCIYDHGCNETVWAMYEGTEGGTEIFHLPQSDLDMIFDMVCMACKSDDDGAFPADLAPVAPPAPQPAAPQQQAPQQQAPQQQTPQPYPTAGQQPYGAQPQAYPPPQGYPQGAPPQGYPQGPPPQGYPPPQQLYGYGQPAPPYGHPGQAPYNPGYPAQAPYPQQQYPAAQNPYGQPAPAPAYNPPASSSPGPDIPIPDFAMMDLLSKGSANVLLGQLFIAAGIVNERHLDSALKLQEMVRHSKLSSEQAIMAMRRATELGGNLDDDIIEWAKNPERVQRARPAGANTGTAPKPAAAAPAAAPSAKDAVASQRIADLLKQAGLVTDEDLDTARRVKSKHGGDLNQILVSAGKLNSKTVDAAGEVQNLVAVGRLRIDKAIMALHYCERMRVSLKEALSELSIELT